MVGIVHGVRRSRRCERRSTPWGPSDELRVFMAAGWAVWSIAAATKS